MHARIRPDVYHCRDCGLWASDIRPTSGKEGFDEFRREVGLVTLRRHNYIRILDTVGSMAGLAGAAVLDVGCAHGWFLRMAKERGAIVTGIEPDPEIAGSAVADAAVRVGFFPEALAPGETFDVVVFNDVIEHIPDIQAALTSCREHLRPGGLLVVNLPLSSGILYRLSVAAGTLGIKGTFDRMWQRGFPSPHVWYLSKKNLPQLARTAGFSVEAFEYLQTMVLTGLWSRVGMDRGGVVPRLFLYTGLVAIYPFVKWLLPRDIGLFVFRAPR
jgi:SAM-dependent methyltransferase